MKIETHISWGYVELIKIFFTANNLDVKCTERLTSSITTHINLEFVDDSDTALSITMMSYRHLGFENMLCDYLRRTGVPLAMISTGRQAIKRDMAQVDKDWENHRKLIGLR